MDKQTVGKDEMQLLYMHSVSQIMHFINNLKKKINYVKGTTHDVPEYSQTQRCRMHCTTILRYILIKRF